MDNLMQTNWLDWSLAQIHSDPVQFHHCTEENINEDNISPLDKLYDGISVFSSV